MLEIPSLRIQRLARIAYTANQTSAARQSPEALRSLAGAEQVPSRCGSRVRRVGADAICRYDSNCDHKTSGDQLGANQFCPESPHCVAGSVFLQNSTGNQEFTLYQLWLGFLHIPAVPRPWTRTHCPGCSCYRLPGHDRLEAQRTSASCSGSCLPCLGPEGALHGSGSDPSRTRAGPEEHDSGDVPDPTRTRPGST